MLAFVANSTLWWLQLTIFKQINDFRQIGFNEFNNFELLLSDWSNGGSMLKMIGILRTGHRKWAIQIPTSEFKNSGQLQQLHDALKSSWFSMFSSQTWPNRLHYYDRKKKLYNHEKIGQIVIEPDGLNSISSNPKISYKFIKLINKQMLNF